MPAPRAKSEIQERAEAGLGLLGVSLRGESTIGPSVNPNPHDPPEVSARGRRS